MAPFLSSLPLITSALLSTEPLNRPPCRRLEVCTSPGCVADGALGTLAKLTALAPPPPPPQPPSSLSDAANSNNNDGDEDDDDDGKSSSPIGTGIIVKEGRCASACGSGPVVIETSGPIERNEDGSDASTTADVRVVHKWIKDEALIKLLEGGSGGVNREIVDGYGLYEQANDMVKLKRRHTAETAELYRQAIDVAAETVVRASTMAAVSDDGADFFVLPPNVEWIVDCYRQLATSKLATFDRDGALEAAQKACDITRSNDIASLEVMAEVCKARVDNEGELGALRKIFELDEKKGGEDEVPRDVALRRREQGFRLASLERLISK